MIVIFPLLVSKNVNTNVVQGLAILLEQYIAAYAISDFVGKSKEFNKYYNYKVKGGKIYQESESSWFDLDPATRYILESNPSLLNEVIYDKYGNPPRKEKKGTGSPGKSTLQPIDPTKAAREAAKDARQEEIDEENKRRQKLDDYAGVVKSVDQVLKDLRQGKDQNKPIEKPGFSSADISKVSINLEPTWVTVRTTSGAENRLGIKVVPMMIEGFNIKHTISMDMQKYFVSYLAAGIGRKAMRFIYRLIDKWTAFGQRPRGDVRHDLFYARTGHDGQPFVLLDKNEDIPKLFLAQPQNMLKLWKLSWGNMLIADDSTKTVMFCMKKYKAMCSSFSYAMIFAQTKEIAKVFEDMENARKAVGALFKMNKKVSSLGGQK